MNLEKFAVEVSASRSKRVVCRGGSTMKYMKREVSRLNRRALRQQLRELVGAWEEGLEVTVESFVFEPQRVTSWDIA